MRLLLRIKKIIAKPGKKIYCFSVFCGRRNIDTFVKSPQSRHSRESGNPELSENTAGFRVKPGMTDKANFDFLRDHQY